MASMDTMKWGVFKQQRVGKKGVLFSIYKLRTMRSASNGSQKITTIGNILRNTKLDELPQLFNVLIGDMSFVGPRPDVEGFADTLIGEDQIVLIVRPGITGIASLYFRNEETLLNKQKDSELYNRTVIWPKKVELNKAYIHNYSFITDIKIIIKTIFNL